MTFEDMKKIVVDTLNCEEEKVTMEASLSSASSAAAAPPGRSGPRASSSAPTAASTCPSAAITA